MNYTSKKVVCLFCAVMALFVGVVIIAKVPAVSVLIAFLEAAIGFACGAFFMQACDQSKQDFLYDEINSLTAALENFKSQNETLRKAATEQKKETKAKKSKTEK